jgi:hypothetical protein
MSAGWKPSPLHRALDRIGTALGLERRFRFVPGDLRQAASRRAGLSDFGDPWFEPGFESLVHSLEREAGLSIVGRIGLHGMVVTLLVNRLLLQIQPTPDERLRDQAPPPLVILGLPRSGTTFLHRLLALDPNHRALPMWQLQRPFALQHRADRRRQETDRVLAWFRRLAPELELKHPVRSDSPEECIWLLNSTFVSHGLWVAAPVYSYLDWLEGCDRRPAYREYARVLTILQGEVPHRRLLLKAPSHAGSLTELLEVWPRALVIQTHRDPVEVLPSLTSLICSVHRSVAREVDPVRTGKVNLQMLLQEMERNRAARSAALTHTVDVEYRELCTDPTGTVRRIYQEFGLPWPHHFERRIEQHLRQTAGHGPGRHVYSSRDFGLEDSSVRKAFRVYRRARGYPD